MQWTSLNDLREKFLSFFESKGHLRMPSFSLIPNNDKSLLLINSGMAPMKKYFTGEEQPPRNRVCTCQKCIRTPDLERVGHTARHGTYFEMLGNFSFGDYFKEEAIPWAWEFLTVTLEIPADLLWPSVYEHDDEAYAIWRDKIGVPEAHIVKLGKADNFWEHGSGPCGPCSEIYFDRGIKYGCGSPDCKPGCDCDRFMEIWNNVFSQFNNDGNGNYTELAQKNIDTGMGLERLACVLQGIDITQRKPIVRLQNGNKGFYADREGYIFPLQKTFSSHVHIVEGEIPINIDSGHQGEITDPGQRDWLLKIVELVCYMEKNKEWEEKVVQIHISKGGDLVLIPREGKERFLFGQPENISDKFDKIKKYYTAIIPEKGKEAYRSVDVRYKGQIICK